MEELIAQLLSSISGIWKYRWLAVAVMCVIGTAGWIRVATMADDYQSTARVFVDTQSILKPLLSGMATLPNVEQQVGIMSRTLLSRPNVERVEQLMAKLKISGTATYDTYTISYNHNNPKLGRDVVQSLLTIFVEGSFKCKKGDSQKAAQFIEEQIESVEAKLVATENAVKEFKMRNSALLPRQGVDYGAQLVLVIESETTTQRAVKEALRRLDSCTHVTLVCNKTRAFPGDDYYGYYD